MCREASRPRQTQQASFGHTQKSSTRKVQTSPANTEGGRSWVRGKKVWFSGKERGKPILEFLLRLFWRKCPAGMTYHPKEVRMSWNH